MTWAGSRADKMERRLAAFERLSGHSDGRIRQAFEHHAIAVRTEIERQRAQERVEDRERDLAFE